MMKGANALAYFAAALKKFCDIEETILFDKMWLQELKSRTNKVSCKSPEIRAAVNL
jgi:hypothetical protein